LKSRQARIGGRYVAWMRGAFQPTYITPRHPEERRTSQTWRDVSRLSRILLSARATR
jgi:hypothetical protein